MSIVDLLFNRDAHLLVGVSDQADVDGSIRVYLDARYTGRHTHVSDPMAITAVRELWSGSVMSHATVSVPADALCDCPEEVAS